MASVLCTIMSASRKQKPGGKGEEGGWRAVGPGADDREGPRAWGLGPQGVSAGSVRVGSGVCWGAPWRSKWGLLEGRLGSLGGKGGSPG